MVFTVRVDVHDEVSEFPKEATLKRFSEIIRPHVFSRTVFDSKCLVVNLVLHKEVSNVHVVRNNDDVALTNDKQKTKSYKEALFGKTS